MLQNGSSDLRSVEHHGKAIHKNDPEEYDQGERQNSSCEGLEVIVRLVSHRDVGSEQIEFGEYIEELQTLLFHRTTGNIISHRQVG